jgi:hypothetical protein
MSLLTRIREFALGPRLRLCGRLNDVWHEEMRLARQLRAHSERVPYPDLAARLLALADRADARAAALGVEVKRLAGTLQRRELGPLRDGRNAWERLAVDAEDSRNLTERYGELLREWDVDFPDAAAAFEALRRDAADVTQALSDMGARADPHAAD